MPRTVVYPEASASRGARSVEPDAPARPDAYPEKLVKYVPAEVVAFYVPAYTMAPDERMFLKWAILLMAAVGTVGYLRLQAPDAIPPRWYFYVLSLVAFFAWALGTTSTGDDLLHLSREESAIALLAGVFLVPMIDEWISRLTGDVRPGENPDA